MSKPEAADSSPADLTYTDLSEVYSWGTANWSYATYNNETVFPDQIDPGGTWIGAKGGSCDDCEAPPTACAADLNGDGEVKVADLLILIAAWGVCP